VSSWRYRRGSKPFAPPRERCPWQDNRAAY
jgi:hypothetical protein